MHPDFPHALTKDQVEQVKRIPEFSMLCHILIVNDNDTVAVVVNGLYSDVEIHVINAYTQRNPIKIVKL